MDRLIYTAMTGASAAAHRQSVLSNNLANASTSNVRTSEAGKPFRFPVHPPKSMRGSGNPEVSVFIKFQPVQGIFRQGKRVCGIMAIHLHLVAIEPVKSVSGGKPH